MEDKTNAGLASFGGGAFDLLLTRPSAEVCEDYRWQIWRALTYQFTHGSLTHVSMNVLANLLYGIPLEGIHGSFLLFVMYNTGVFGGAVCALVNDPHIAVVGMSGGCYALIGMHLADLLINWHHKRYRLLTVAMIFFLAVVDLWTFAAANKDISHSAHLGGYVAGTLVGLLIGKDKREEQWERYLKFAAFMVGAGLLTFCFGWSVLQWPPRDIWDEFPWCWARQVKGRGVCLRCADQKCIDHWNNVATKTGHELLTVSISACRKAGWLGEAHSRWTPSR